MRRGGTTAIDPVCKMEVDTKNPPGGKAEHQGQTYYFCAPGCRRSFEKEPEKFLGEHSGGMPMGHH
ncbi:MAG: YHS domain-containing protein [Chloroflexi bacterium]|nr:YHS domain-containing protein [Chloroflexota bacterium]